MNFKFKLKTPKFYILEQNLEHKTKIPHQSSDVLNRISKFESSNIDQLLLSGTAKDLIYMINGVTAG